MTGITLVLLAVWGSIGYSVTESRKAKIAEEQRVLARIARVVQEQTHSLVLLIDYFLVSADLWFQNHPNADPRSDAEFLRLVEILRTKTSGMVDIRLVSETGGLFYVGRTGNKPLAEVADRDYYRAQTQPDTKGLFIAQPVLSRVTGLWGLPISYPLKAKPRGMAVIFAAIENRVLTSPFEDARTHPGGSIFIAHRNGTVLFRSPDEMGVGKSVNGSVLWKKYLPEANEGVYQVEESVLDRQSRIVAYAAVPDYPLVVVTSSVSDEVLRDWRTKTFAMLGFGLVVSLCCLVVLWRLRVSVQSLDDMRQKFEEQANVDHLTNIPNRRFFVHQSTKEIQRCGRHKRPLSLLMCDIDLFKGVNDTFGHEMGDEILKAVTQAFQEELRTTDIQGRLGGEEFGVLLPETSQEDAIEVAERLRQRIEHLSLKTQHGQCIDITISVGVSTLMTDEDTLELLMARSDRALYQAKSAGRNRVCV